MRAALFSSLLLAGLLLMHCSLQVHCSEAAAAKRKVKPHHHMPVMDPEEQKAQSMLQERPRRPHAQQLAPVAPLDPACVPKYVTDLVIPPPMPIAPPGGVLAEAQQEPAEDAQVGIASIPQKGARGSVASLSQPSSTARSRDIVDSTQDWEYHSIYHKQKKVAPAPALAPTPREPKRDNTLNDDYWESFGMHGGDSTQKKAPRKKKAPPTDEDEDQPNEEYYIKYPKKYTKYPKYPHHPPEPHPPAPQPDPQPPTPQPPVQPPPVQPPPVQPPPVQPPPVQPPPVQPPPVQPPPVQPPPVQPPPVQPPPPLPVITDVYDISVRQILQQVLPPQPNALPTCPATFSSTAVFAYGPANVAGQPFHNWPGFTIETQHNIPTQITWTNDLKDAAGNFLPHILRDSIDQTIHWANPTALGGSIDSSPCHLCQLQNNCAADPACVTASTTTYTGPVPIITHVHGQNSVYDWTDGYTEAWYMPAANNLAGYFDVGTWYDTFEQAYTTLSGQQWAPGSVTGVYRNNQRATALWYHDHALGLTRTNVFAGMAGFYFIREKFPSIANGPELPGIPYPAYDGVIPLNRVRELPLAIQDRSFTTDSQLWYPVADQVPGTTLPNGPLPPRWIPEYAATVLVNGVATNMLVMTVNGKTYPKQTVYPDAYRLRILNGCNSRTLQLRFARSTQSQIDPLSSTVTAGLLPFYVIGNEGGWFSELQPAVTTLEVGPAERYDVIIDFSGLAPGQFVFMLNNGPETDTAIYDGTNNGVGLTIHTAQIMRFDVSPLPPDQTARPFDLSQQVLLNTAMRANYAATVAPLPPPPPTAPIREVTLLEQLTATGIPIAVLLGTASPAGNAVPTPWSGPTVTDVANNVVHYWDIINLSADSHPIHLHNVAFEYFGRFALQLDPANPNAFVKTTIPVTNADLDPWLQTSCGTDIDGNVLQCPTHKDTIMVLPGSYTRIGFMAPAEAGLYVWHCHLLEHEDNEMMVPLCFGSPPYPDPRRPGQLMCPGPN